MTLYDSTHSALQSSLRPPPKFPQFDDLHVPRASSLEHKAFGHHSAAPSFGRNAPLEELMNSPHTVAKLTTQPDQRQTKARVRLMAS
mmetsp:Transcript_29723/g.70067  ORF Transcript_29723/g.70067 Transcript_29723/m.70067 type:complete len:87 (-) Transcript_29723:772-1032(-)